MADPSRPRSDGDAGAGPGYGSEAGAPRWVKVFGIVALVLVLLIVVAMLVGGGGHGPGRHAPSGGTGAPPAHVYGRA